MKNALFAISAALMITSTIQAQNFKQTGSGVFTPQQKKVVLLRDSASHKQLILFKTNLHVNTDGTPLSYHPYDLNGDSLALNTIGNAVAVRKNGSNKNLCLSKSTYKEAIRVYQQFRNSEYKTVPAGYSITWNNVLIADTVDGRKVPCVFKSGPYKGYYSSATSLKNALSGNKGECQCEDQVNPLKIPALVMVGGSDNIVRKYGGRLGDLIIAYNPKNDQLVYGIINDSGPDNNLGEGSVLLNMKLLGDSILPKNRKDVYKRLSISSDIVVGIIPGSNTYQVIKPYSYENINIRVGKWLQDAGFENREAYVKFIKEVQL